MWGSKKIMKKKNEIKNGNRNTSIDSDLPDSIVFREAVWRRSDSAAAATVR